MWAHLACFPVPVSRWERKLAVTVTENGSFLFSGCVFFFLFRDLRLTQCAVGYTRACVGPRQSISIHFYWWGAHERAFISRTKRLIYFSQGIKGHCKSASSSLSDIKSVRRHKRIPVNTESEDHYRTSWRSKVKGAKR